MDIQFFYTALGDVFSVINLLVIILSVAAGTIVGVIPGLGPFLLVVVLLPFTFSLAPQTGLLALMGAFIGGAFGGAISAIVLGIPGTPMAAATLFDGHPMAKKGQTGKAIGLATTASVFGGILSVLILIFFAPYLARIAIKFGPPEYVILGIMGLSTIAIISRENTIKGLIAGTIGLFLATVGTDVSTAAQRFTFNLSQLGAGLGLIPVLLGIFAVSEMLMMLENKPQKNVQSSKKLYPQFPSWQEFKELFATYLKSSFIGTFIGALPGVGSVMAAFISYGEAKRSSKKPESFGNGAPEGVVASEAANSAVTGGALIPMLTLGIPGDAITAVVMGALFMQGLVPGPNLFKYNSDMLASLFLGLLLANIALLFIGMYGSRLFVQITKVEKGILIPAVMVICILGTWAINTSYLDVLLMLFFGLIGFGLRKANIPLPPLVLGMVLGPIIEQNLRRTLAYSRGSPLIFFTRSYSLTIFILLLLLIFWMVKKRKTEESNIVNGE